MALRACVWNVELFLPETLQWAGWHYASLIYKQVINNDTLSFNVWNIFLDAFPDKMESQEFHVYQSGNWSFEPTELPSIVKRLSKLNTSFLTLLCIRDFILTLDHLVSLLDIPTLAAVLLEQAPPGGKSPIEDIHFKSWVSAAHKKSALQKLKLLVLCDFGIERKSVLERVSVFPSLSLLGFQNSKTGKKHGWSHIKLDPYYIWSASYLTSAQKLKRLQDLMKENEQRASMAPGADDRSVCITYGGWANRSIHECTLWYIREFKTLAQNQMPKITAESENGSSSKAGGRAANKKRKLRVGKQVDVGSLLGAFR
ncbi:hypothetical protein GQ44DRAFT_612021 [Phaeosphaeriaceae sp. PMI808]|nr:hypothetical protein GQ44DRAFT_612021 [Phaeosphaeriaceae sp. PMI808]